VEGGERIRRHQGAVFQPFGEKAATTLIFDCRPIFARCGACTRSGSVLTSKTMSQATSDFHSNSVDRKNDLFRNAQRVKTDADSPLGQRQLASYSPDRPRRLAPKSIIRMVKPGDGDSGVNQAAAADVKKFR
jgi:hypothetical protein